MAEAEAFVPQLQQIWSTPQSREQLVAHSEPEVMELVRHRVLERSEPGRSQDARSRTQRPPMHPEEPTCPCCLPALGDSVRYRRMGGWRRV